MRSSCRRWCARPSARTEPERSPSAVRAPHSGRWRVHARDATTKTDRLLHAEDASDLAVGLVDGLVEARHVAATGLREVGPAAAAPADDLGHLVDELPGLETIGDRLGDHHRDLCFVAGDSAEQN